VLSVNAAHHEQKSPTIAIAPNGEIIDEISSEKEELVEVLLDLKLVSNWYLDQSRKDLIDINLSKKSL
ncbi:MAG: hypothetical protein ACXAD7_04820, partial [Candidatus Kariarchaeaceae archaeon]